ncbi:MAG: hypothetical protein SFT94_02225 [Pseudanabaenaceae cyanobacterium bins.68]|nr:hypothetical protein [Pseudanabaenaceae cyanobacterium bins.68]
MEDLQSAEINLSAIELAKKLAVQVISLTEKYNALLTEFDAKLSEALAEDAIEDEEEIAEAVASRLAEVRANIEAEFEAAEAAEDAAEAESVAGILNQLGEAGISLFAESI